MTLPDSVLRLARTYPPALTHAEQVARLAALLFACLQPLLGLDDEARLLLLAAAWLHDIGWVEGQQGHHKTALRRILAAPLPPFDDHQRLLVALIARYHRKALPKESHAEFAALSAVDRRLVSLLGGLLRLADGLDVTHRAAIRGIRCEADKHTLRIYCEGDGDLTAERQAAMKKSDLLSETLGREIILAS